MYNLVSPYLPPTPLSSSSWIPFPMPPPFNFMCVCVFFLNNPLSLIYTAHMCMHGCGLVTGISSTYQGCTYEESQFSLSYQPPAVTSSSAKSGSFHVLPQSMPDCWLAWPCPGLGQTISAALSSPAQLPCGVWRPVFQNSAPPPLAFTFFLPSFLRWPLGLGRSGCGMVVPFNFEFLMDTIYQVKEPPLCL